MEKINVAKHIEKCDIDTKMLRIKDKMRHMRFKGDMMKANKEEN